MIRVLVVDDHDLVRTGITRMLADIDGLQVVEAFQRRRAGSWVIDQVINMARQERRTALRLTVFENNPARNLYESKGLQVQGRDECFLRMQLDISTHVL